MAKDGDGGNNTSYVQTVHGNRKVADAHQRQADLLGQLIKSRQKGARQLKKQYKSAVRRYREVRKSTVADLIAGQKSAAEGYDRSQSDAEANLGNAASASVLNRAREGSHAMAELSNMQAGETDRIRGMSASLRNMKANLDGGASDYANAMTSINNALGDLNTTVSTNINNALREENASRAQAFAEHTAGLQQAQSDLVDLYGQQGSAYEQVTDALATKTSKTRSSGTKHVKSTQTDTTAYGKGSRSALRKAKKAFDNSADASRRLARLQGRTYKGKIKTIDEMNAGLDLADRYKSLEARENRSNLDDLANAGTLQKLAAPEGSTLRKKVV